MPVKTLALAAVGAWGLMVAGLYTLQRQLMYFPTRERPDPQAWNLPREVQITLRTEDDHDIVSWHHPPADPGRPTILYFHGNAGHLGERVFKIEAYLKAGYGVMLGGYRGFAGNPGKPDEPGLYRDARAALRHLEDCGVAHRDLVLYGESLGTGIAVQVAREMADLGRPAAAVVLEAPFSSAGDVAASRYPYVPARTLLRDKYDSVAKIDGIHAPVLIIHGDEDATVPQRFGRKLFEAAREPKVAHWIPGAGHTDLHDFELERRTLEFLEHYVEVAPARAHG